MTDTTRAESPRYDADETAGADALKVAFRHHPAGVSLIAARTPEGPVGLTASSVASVGIDPATISFSVTRATGSAGGILNADSYVVHLLDERHAAIAATFAVSGTERFTPEQGWRKLVTGEPYLPDTRVALRCRTLHSLGVGSSVIVVAEVLGAVFGAAAGPMVHVDRTFRGVGPEISN
ncbi:flavin reductase family protein [Leucobacter luti]|uniref:Flavin reductase (DIM6/NTAB) family NADH-FMN oxidoreductase RutF n=1 Tax=Leucobacter luti TaxID=340320 RepID=A0A4R6RRK4_9MICO|nr:flavin reductase family protein [Leucobacter luti]MCW2287873.1 flavin reductase (DIM6/NTAB) family NADH-FMN oxidoreductase RutF [Leucobacter luti]QYM76126.1 flavin reductase family protein [Leucobacter luti]TCK45964.1 flavin reductase (DIM6/NTAB) family NADH-FMN oxidoreductase RutF [Leucobacter luti]TDP89461.1 flavin reductase (DIM6/NTAB) family NADH-FMN oxidoreductase RutF [Leucobacter luti]